MTGEQGNGSEPIFQPRRRPPTPLYKALLVVIIAVSLLPLAMVGYHTYAYPTFSYTMGPDALSLRYGLTVIQLPYDELARVQHVDDPERLRRVRGTNIPGRLQSGHYHLAGYGRVYRLTTQNRPLVYVDTRDDAATAAPATRYLLSPRESRAFVRALDRAAGGAPPGQTEPVVYAPAPGDHPATSPVLLLAAVLTLAVAVALPLYVVRGRRRLAYRVTPRGLVIAHAFSDQTIPWTGIQSVERLEERLRGIRTMGASLPGYHAGSFNLSGLGSVKVYATEMKPPLVLVTTHIGQYVLSPADVDGFLAAAAHHISDR